MLRANKPILMHSFCEMRASSALLMILAKHNLFVAPVSVSVAESFVFVVAVVVVVVVVIAFTVFTTFASK